MPATRFSIAEHDVELKRVDVGQVQRRPEMPGVDGFQLIPVNARLRWIGYAVPVVNAHTGEAMMMGQRLVLIGVLSSVAMSMTVTMQTTASDEEAHRRSCGDYHQLVDGDDLRTKICSRLRGFWLGYATRFGTFDRNGDGVVSAEEASDNAEEAFRTMDTNENDRVTFREFMEIRMGHGKALAKQRQAVRRRENETWFAEMDTNRDANLSRLEFFEAARRHYLKSDANEDGKVTLWELRAQRGIF